MKKEIHSGLIEPESPKERLNRWLNDAIFEIYPDPELIGKMESVAALGNKFAVTASPTKPIEESVKFSIELRKVASEVHTHLSARKIRDMEHLKELTGRLTEGGIRHLFVIAGDGDKPEGIFDSAIQVLQGIRKLGIRFDSIGVGCYPEGHTLINETELDKALKEKQKYSDTYGENMYAISQMCFDDGIIQNWLSDQRNKGIRMPYYAGVVAPMSYLTLANFVKRCGIRDTTNFLKNPVLTQKMAMGAFTGYRPDELLLELAKNADVSGILVFTLNSLEKTQKWIDSLQKTL